jgi:hypothetical protein
MMRSLSRAALGSRAGVVEDPPVAGWAEPAVEVSGGLPDLGRRPAWARPDAAAAPWLLAPVAAVVGEAGPPGLPARIAVGDDASMADPAHATPDSAGIPPPRPAADVIAVVARLPAGPPAVADVAPLVGETGWLPPGIAPMIEAAYGEP